MAKNKKRFLDFVNFKNKKTFVIILSLLIFAVSGLGVFVVNKLKTDQQEAKASGLALPGVYQVNLNPTPLNVGQVYNLNTSNIKFSSTNPYYNINVDYTFSSPGKRRIYAKLKGLESNSYYPVSNLCINDQLSRETRSDTSSLSGSGVFSGSGLFKLNTGLNTDKVTLAMPYFWYNNPKTFDQCRTANTSFTAPEFQFTNYNYKAFNLQDNYSAVVSITESPSNQIDPSEIIYFITSLPKKSTIYLSGKAESDYLVDRSHNFRFYNPSEAGKPSTPTPCQRSTYYYLNTDVIDCFTQKDLETGKVKIKALSNTTYGFDQIKLVAFDKFYTKAFDYNFNIVNPNAPSEGTSVTFKNNQNPAAGNSNANAAKSTSGDLDQQKNSTTNKPPTK